MAAETAREIEKFPDMDQMFWDGQREKWKEELQEIEQKRNELLPEHQRMQKRSQKMQSLKDKKKNCLKDTVRVMKRCARSEMKSMKRGTFSWSNWRMAADDLEDEIRGMQAGEERRVRWCRFDSVMEQLFTLEAAHAGQQIRALQNEFNRRFEVPATPVYMAKREERGVGRGVSAMSSQSPDVSTSARWAQ